MTFAAIDLAAAWALDAWIGDPAWIPWPHPVVLIGRVVTRLEKTLHNGGGAAGLRFRGFVLWVTVVGGAGFLGWFLLWAAHGLHPVLGRGVGIYLAYTCLATRCLDREARQVGLALRRGRLPEARRRLSGIVGRDTDPLPPEEVARATVETVAENTSDGVVAPVFYLVLGGVFGVGPALAVAYKAANTLDSMVGYRDNRYEQFGKVSARADDLLNWAPARITALAGTAAAQGLWRRGRQAWDIMLRDARAVSSPNAGYPEAAWAGALGIRLGGTRTYRGVLHPSPHLGDAERALDHRQVPRALEMLWAVSATAAGTGCLILLVA